MSADDSHARQGSPVDRSAASREALSRWLFGIDRVHRFTQDSPILPKVWFAYGDTAGGPVDLLLIPEARATAAELTRGLHDELGASHARKARLAYNESYVAVTLTFAELIRHVLPLSVWWQTRGWTQDAGDMAGQVERHRDAIMKHLNSEVGIDRRRGDEIGEFAWFLGTVGRILLAHDATPDPEAIATAAMGLLQDVPGADPQTPASGTLWTINMNRSARTAVSRSRKAIKADAAQRVFDVSCADLCWAVIDTGIDATHPAFRRRDPTGAMTSEEPTEALAHTRVRATYDFTRLRDLLTGDLPPGVPDDLADELDHLRERLKSGRAIDWDRIEPLLRVEHVPPPGDTEQPGFYEQPVGEHGTHVAGILGGDWRADDEGMPSDDDLRGICPDIALYDLRVFDERGVGEEFVITAALQFVRHLNVHSDLQVIHGVNLSLSIDHDVTNYACGRTPVCDEAERLMASGVVVVTVAGNEGRAEYASERGPVDGYRTASITDPGNAERIITVGATHRYEAHTYGVSYFSSRGPTGDGRCKPDLVAPGEKIEAPVPGADAKIKDGTSQAAPHVSGAAALLMARHEELRGQPSRIKQILCEAATDLGRERYYQGAGMLDVLRAMQVV